MKRVVEPTAPTADRRERAVEFGGQIWRAGVFTALQGRQQADGKNQRSNLSAQPVSFRYKGESEPTRPLGFGLIAEDVEKINPDLVVHDKEGKPYSVRYDQVNAILLNEFLKEHHKNEQLEKQIEALTVGLQKVSAQLELNKPAPQTVAKNQ